MNGFDKELTRIIVDVYNMGWNDRDSKQIPTTISSITQALDESKQAVDKYVIGKDLPSGRYNAESLLERDVIVENNTLSRQRQSLWGDK